MVRSDSAWTVQALYEHTDQRFNDLEQSIERRFDSQDAATKAALVAAEKAVDKAEQLATTRADDQNEWRETVNDVLASYKGEHVGVSSTVLWLLGGVSAISTTVALFELLVK